MVTLYSVNHMAYFIGESVQKLFSTFVYSSRKAQRIILLELLQNNLANTFFQNVSLIALKNIYIRKSVIPYI